MHDSPNTMERIPITPQMLRTAVKKLQMNQLFVELKSLEQYIQKHYPVEGDFLALQQELQEKLKYAVCVGLLAKHGEDQYYIPTLRQEANAVKAAITAFWELYKNNNRLVNTRKKIHTKQSMHQRRKNYTNFSESDESNTSEDLDII